MISAVKAYFLELRKNICLALEKEERQKKFLIDDWLGAEGGEGKTCVLEEGSVIERGAVNFSHIFSAALPPSATQRHPQLLGSPFQAMGVSLVIHPRNPYVPAVHMNLRFFYLEENKKHPAIWWFGGGFDLTPFYPFLVDCQHWHSVASAACRPFGSELYAQYKRNCDEYFYLKHRKEARGVGGLFFDDLNQWDFETSFRFVQNVGQCFSEAYLPIVQRRKNNPYGERERFFQAYRRGRYVEFNLIYDRGTLFGLQSGGRVESILVSMPPQAHWHYNWQPELDSCEEVLIKQYLVPREWISPSD